MMSYIARPETKRLKNLNFVNFKCNDNNSDNGNNNDVLYIIRTALLHTIITHDYMRVRRRRVGRAAFAARTVRADHLKRR
jgi:hypothetical protein